MDGVPERAARRVRPRCTKRRLCGDVDVSHAERLWLFRGIDDRTPASDPVEALPWPWHLDRPRSARPHCFDEKLGRAPDRKLPSAPRLGLTPSRSFSNGSDHRSRHRRTPRGADPASSGQPAPRPPHCPPLGPVDRQTSRSRRRPLGFIMAALDAGVPLGDVQIAARHADPRTTTIYDRRRENFDRHAAYVVVAFVAGG
jgi:hypothetical protein